MTKPLSGLRILDLTNVLAGPFCAYQLAQLGADVIKVERPDGGDLARQLGADVATNKLGMGTSFVAQNAGKQSMTLNLKHAEGKLIFRRLVSGCDAVIENFRPGVMKRLGLDYDALCNDKPDLVYCAISGYGASGPLQNNPAYDQIIQGMSGLMSVTGDTDSAPLRVGYPIADTLGGLTAAFATTAALLQRERTGKGDYIDVSMLESTLASMGWVVSNWLLGGIHPEPLGNENMTAAPSGTFRTGNGLLNIAANTQAQFESLCRLIDREAWIKHPLYADPEDRKQHRAQLRIEIEQQLASDSATNWAARLNACGVPSGEVMDVPSILRHAQIQERHFVQQLEPPAGLDHEIAVVRAGFRLRSGDPQAEHPPQFLGAQTNAILQSLGYADEDIEALRRAGVV